MTNSSADDIYRVRYSSSDRRSGYASGQTEIFTAAQLPAMLTMLLEAHLEEKSSSQYVEGRRISHQLRRAFSGEWLKYLTSSSELSKRVRKIVAVEKHTTEGWVPLKYEFVEPSIILDEGILP